jgi:hypothetical protein
MILRFYEDDGGQQVVEADEEGIEYLRTGLWQLEQALPGEELSAPSLVSGDEGPRGVGEVILRRR